jgi:hypothetical protein
MSPEGEEESDIPIPRILQMGTSPLFPRSCEELEMILFEVVRDGPHFPSIAAS